MRTNFIAWAAAGKAQDGRAAERMLVTKKMYRGEQEGGMV